MLQHPRDLLAPHQLFFGSGWTRCQEIRDLMILDCSPPRMDLSWSSRTSQSKADTLGQPLVPSFGASSSQEELFGLFSITSVSCSHQDLPASPTIPEETELQEQMDPRSRFHGTSHVRHSRNHLSPHKCCQQTCWGPITPKTQWGHPNLPSQRGEPLVSVCTWGEMPWKIRAWKGSAASGAAELVLAPTLEDSKTESSLGL